MLINYPERKLNRKRNFDYSSNGFYFVTICIKNRIEYFGQVKNKKMVINEYGKIVEKCWFDLINHYYNCRLDEFVIMPNHVHGIIEINNDLNLGTDFESVRTDKKYSLSAIIQGFKIFSSRRINEINHEDIFRWQRSFYDHIIRNQESLNRIRQYIKNNPSKWFHDRNNLLEKLK